MHVAHAGSVRHVVTAGTPHASVLGQGRTGQQCEGDGVVLRTVLDMIGYFGLGGERDMLSAPGYLATMVPQRSIDEP